MQSPNGPGFLSGGLRPAISLAAGLGIFGLAALLTAVPEWTTPTDDGVEYLAEIQRLRADLVEMNSRHDLLLQDLSRRAGQIETNLGEVEGLRLTVADASADQADLDRQMRSLRQELDTRLQEVVQAREASSPTSERSLLRQRILGPVFQLTGTDAVGSAVLVHEVNDPGEPHGYLALSCYHVVRDILEERGRVDRPMQESYDALFFNSEGDELRLQSRLVAFSTDLDLALLRIDTEHKLPSPARLAPLSRLKEIEVFSPVYTVGCPLGTYAQATHGQVTHRNWKIDGLEYWMVSSPAYFGNSGGGVFLEETCELAGIFAKIYTHGTFRPQVITHMGLVVPLSTLHRWLREVGYGRILP